MKHLSHLSKLFYIHRELGVALMLAIAACIELLCSLFVDAPWQYLAYAFAAALALLAGLLVRNVIRFEQKYSTPSNN